jgi:GNAT superfamily N-acetyltransferase
VTETGPGSLPELPIRVRRAGPGDTRAVLDFTRATWEGWDYIPSVWDSWLEAPDGVLLVATPNAPHQLDLFGRPLSPGRPIGIARVALLAAGEAWLEGLRVDPGVRNRGVARLLHGACLEWARAQGATVVRYATGQGNEGSHRLGARHGFRLLRPWRSYQPPRDEHADEEDGLTHADEADAADADQFADLADDVGGQVPVDVAARATGVTPDEVADEGPPGQREWGEADGPPSPEEGDVLSPAGARRRLRRAGLSLDPDAPHGTVQTWWSRVSSDPTFRAGDRLYEFRSWAFQELTPGRFEGHVRSGEVMVRDGSPWGLAIVPLDEPRFTGDRPWAAVVAGDGSEVIRLAVAIRDALGLPIRLRVPDGAPVVEGHADALTAAGFPPAGDALHVLVREMAADDAIDLGPPGAVTFEEPPRRVAVAPHEEP